MDFTVPEGWQELTQEQLEHVLRMLWIYRSTEEAISKAKVALLMYFCNIEVDTSIDDCFLCREKESGDTFLLDRDLLPDMVSHLDWLDRPEEMSIRLERVGRYQAVDFELRELLFGQYLMADNYYQAFLAGNDEQHLQKMARVLYNVPDDDEGAEFKEHILLGIMLWWMAAKKMLARWFSNFLKPSEGGSEITRESMMEGMRAQIRLLTGGDVTKEEYILTKVDTWTALAELDAKAREAEEINKKYGGK